MNQNLVTLNPDGKIFTTSLLIAEGCALTHRTVIRLVRKYRPDFEEFGQLNFQSSVISRTGSGEQTEYALLDESQATYLITLFRNTPIVRHFKKSFVKAFAAAQREIARLRSTQLEPKWHEVRQESKRLYTAMLAPVIEGVKLREGKQASRHDYINEGLLIAEAVTGERKGGQIDTLTAEQITIRNDCIRLDAKYLAQGLSYQVRKRLIFSHAVERTRLLSSVASEVSK